MMSFKPNRMILEQVDANCGGIPQANPTNKFHPVRARSARDVRTIHFEMNREKCEVTLGEKES
jgi:hypothetical protein